MLLSIKIQEGIRVSRLLYACMSSCLQSLIKAKPLAGMARVPITAGLDVSAYRSPNHMRRRTIPLSKLHHRRLDHAASVHNWR